MIPGVTLKIIFNGGDSSGYELDIHAYNAEKNEFDLIGYED
ncbi:MAG: hypothetical protein ABI045_07400 [Flavobacteriales bacterium]